MNQSRRSPSRGLLAAMMTPPTANALQDYPTAYVAPGNVCTRKEFDDLVTGQVKLEIEARIATGKPPLTGPEMANLMGMTVQNINYGIVPAGNA